MRIAEYRKEFKKRLKISCPKVVLYEEQAWWNKHANESSSHRDFGTATKSVTASSFAVFIYTLILVLQKPLVRLHV